MATCPSCSSSGRRTRASREEERAVAHAHEPHTHTHAHEHTENYFLDQIFTIALCGALGAIGVLLYVRKTMLGIMLDRKFHPYVLAGGIALLVLVVIRAVAVWRLAGHVHTHDHHDHDHDHAHDHHHHDHH